MSRYDGLIIPRSYSEYINKTDAATLQQALQLSGVLSGAVAAGDNKAVTSNAVNGALANYEVKQNIGYGISRTTYKISFPKNSYLKIITRGCEEVTVYRGTELKAFRNSNTYTKVCSIDYADNYLYVTIEPYAEQTYILTDIIKTIETSTIPTTVTNIPITEIATKSDLGIKNITIKDTAHNFGGVGTDELYAEFDLSSYKVSPCAYIGFLRCGGAQSKAYLFTFGLVVSYGNWAFSEISKSWQGANLTFDITTSKLRMTLTDNAIGLYEDSLTLLKIQ